MILSDFGSDPASYGVDQTERSSRPRVAGILIVKQDSLQAEILRQRCAACFGDATVNVLRDCGSALRILERGPIDLILTGLSLPDMDGIEFLSRLSSRGRRIVIVSAQKDERTLSLLRCARFDGFFDPQTDEAHLLDEVLTSVADGGSYMSSSVRAALLDSKGLGLTTARLTSTELRVLSAIGDGSDDREAAEALRVGAGTIHSHRASIMRKLGIRSSRKLVLEAVRLGIVRVDGGGVVRRLGEPTAFGKRRM